MHHVLGELRAVQCSFQRQMSPFPSQTVSNKNKHSNFSLESGRVKINLEDVPGTKYTLQCGTDAREIRSDAGYIARE